MRVLFIIYFWRIIMSDLSERLAAYMVAKGAAKGLSPMGQAAVHSYFRELGSMLSEPYVPPTSDISEQMAQWRRTSGWYPDKTDEELRGF